MIGVADVLKGGPSTFLQTGADQPTSVAVSRDGTHVYAALSATESIDYINVATGAIDAQIAVPGGSAQSLGISPDGNRLYASFEGDGALIRSNV